MARSSLVGGLVLLLAWPAAAPLYAQEPDQSPPPMPVPSAHLVGAERLDLPAPVDSNSPAVWEIVDGEPTLIVLTSWGGQIRRSTGRSIETLEGGAPVAWIDPPPGGVWIEAIVRDAEAWYGYYHNEIADVACPGSGRVLPRIGAARSTDFGATWENLGIVLEAPPGTERCDTPNQFFVGGVGDFSVILDRESRDLYFFFSQYWGETALQGVALARMAWADRDEPQGRMTVWRDYVWLPPGWAEELDEEGTVVGGHWEQEAGTPIYAARASWHGPSPDVHWGPSVHWNADLELYVMLLNRAESPEWGQAGVYVSFAASLDDPGGWTPPQLLIAGGLWYPQVLGLDIGAGTDSHAGASARFFQGGRSDHLITFAR